MELTEPDIRILDLVAEHWLTDMKPISGFDLRQEFGRDVDLSRLLDGGYIELVGRQPQPKDHYTLTKLGAKATAAWDAVRGAIEVVISYMKKFKKAGMYSFAELDEHFTGSSIVIVFRALEVFGFLLHGTGPNRLDWQRPDDIEDILECTTADDIEALRESQAEGRRVEMARQQQLARAVEQDGVGVLWPSFVKNTNGQERNLLCNVCGPEKRHVVERSYFDVKDDDYGERYWFDYEICRCLGCDAIVFREGWRTSHEQNCDPETGAVTLDEHEELWHTRAARHTGVSVEQLPDDLRAAYLQTKAAMGAGHHILAGVGLRAILEFVASDKTGQGNKLKQQIRSLVNAGKCPFEVDTLDKIRFIGNDAAHRLDQPSHEEIDIGMRLVENLLDAFYVLPKQAEKIQRRESGDE